MDATSRDSVKELMRARGLVDVLIPRGGADLIRSVVEDSTVPVIETGVGNCHVYVDEAADLDMALRILLNAKTSRPSVCNAAESLLVHAAVADSFLARALPALRDAGVTVHGDPSVVAAGATAGVPVRPATDDDYAAEYLSMDISAAVVPSLDDAIVHIRQYGSGHTEAIVTGSQAAARRFTAEVDAAAVAVNASTRFTDGGEFGFGAEIGISTQKLHARGPDGSAGTDLHQVPRRRRRPHPLTLPCAWYIMTGGAAQTRRRTWHAQCRPNGECPVSSIVLSTRARRECWPGWRRTTAVGRRPGAWRGSVHRIPWHPTAGFASAV